MRHQQPPHGDALAALLSRGPTPACDRRSGGIPIPRCFPRRVCTYVYTTTNASNAWLRRRRRRRFATVAPRVVAALPLLVSTRPFSLFPPCSPRVPQPPRDFAPLRTRASPLDKEHDFFPFFPSPPAAPRRSCTFHSAEFVRTCRCSFRMNFLHFVHRSKEKEERRAGCRKCRNGAINVHFYQCILNRVYNRCSCGFKL